MTWCIGNCNLFAICNLGFVILLTSPWPLYTALHGMSLSPHGGSVALNIDALPTMLNQLFLFGSFGIHWYAITALTISLMVLRNPIHVLRENPVLLWGLLVTIAMMIIYLITNETRGLIQGDNFSRAMLLPTMLMTLGICLAFGPNRPPAHSKSKNLDI